MPVGGEVSEGVYEPGVYDFIDSFALFFGKAVFAFVGLRVGQILLLVGYVQVTAEDNWLLFIKVGCNKLGTQDPRAYSGRLNGLNQA